MSYRRTAGIDVGSNSLLLLILSTDNQGAERVVLDRSDITRLGEGVDASHRLGEAAMARTLDQLGEYSALCRDNHVRSVRAVGTSALRDATNRDEFLARAKAQTGLTIEVISGEVEAELTYAAVAAERVGDGPLANIDIGGGSTEIIRGHDGQLTSRRSIDIGAGRLAERCAPLHDPLTTEDLQRLSEMADRSLAGVPSLAEPVVGTGGTITTLAAVVLAKPVYDPAAVSRTRLTRSAVLALADRLGALPLVERACVPGLPPKRAATIVPGAMLMAALMARLGADEIGVSSSGLRFTLARQALAGPVERGPWPAGRSPDRTG